MDMDERNRSADTTGSVDRPLWSLVDLAAMEPYPIGVGPKGIRGEFEHLG